MAINILYQDFEAILPKLAGLTLGVLAETEFNINKMIISPEDPPLIVSIKKALLLRGAEFGGDLLVSKVIDLPPPNIEDILQFSTIEQTLAIAGALFLIDRSGFEKEVERYTGTNRVLKSIALSLIYMVAQETVFTVGPLLAGSLV